MADNMLASLHLLSLLRTRNQGKEESGSVFTGNRNKKPGSLRESGILSSLQVLCSMLKVLMN
jgi:hypothetical protein